MRRAALSFGLVVLLAGCVMLPRPRPVSGAAPESAAARISGAAPAAKRFVDGATHMLGQPYRWGGAEPGGFDCSGLVFYAAAGAGLHLPRTAAEQRRVGRAVARRELRAGDLVFLHLAHKQLHVGIALDSDRFVNAPAAGGHVRIDSLASPAFAHGFLQARRVVDDSGRL